jgi:hypothetical protein
MHSDAIRRGSTDARSATAGLKSTGLETDHKLEQSEGKAGQLPHNEMIKQLCQNRKHCKLSHELAASNGPTWV